MVNFSALLLLAVLGAVPSGPATAVAEADGRIWVGSAGAGLYRLEPRGELRSAGGPEFEATALAADGKDLWIGTSRGLLLRAQGQIRPTPAPPGADSFVLALAVPRRGEVWASFAGILFRRTGSIWSRAAVDSGIATALFARAGDVWIGTTEGAYRGNRRLFRGEIREIASIGRGGPVVFLDAEGRIRSDTGAVLLAEGYGVSGLFSGEETGILWAFDRSGWVKGFSRIPGGEIVPVREVRAHAAVRGGLASGGRILLATGEGFEEVIVPQIETEGRMAQSEEAAPPAPGGGNLLDRLYPILPSIPTRLEGGIFFLLGIVAGLLFLWFAFLFARHARGSSGRLVMKTKRPRRTKPGEPRTELPAEVEEAIHRFQGIVEKINRISLSVASREMDEALENEIRSLQAELVSCEESLRGMIQLHEGDAGIVLALREVMGETG